VKTQNSQQNYSLSAAQYLEARGIPQADQERLGIHWVSHETATSKQYGYGTLAASPDGIIVFHLGGDSSGTAAKNYFATPQSQPDHLAMVNRHRQAHGLSPTQRVPKYLLPVGAKSCLYDPYLTLNPGTDEPVLFATEDVIGVTKAALRGHRVHSTFGVWLITAEEMKDGDVDPSWLSQYQGRFPVYLADSDALTNPHVMQAIIRTGYRLMVPVGAFPIGADGSKVGLDEYLDSGEDIHALTRNREDIAEFVHKRLPLVQPALERSGLPFSQAANRAGEIYTAVIRELARNVTCITSFKTCYGEPLKKLGFGVADWRSIYLAVKPNRALSDSPRLLARALVTGELRDRVCYESKLRGWYLYSRQEFCWELVERETVSAQVNRAIEKTIHSADFDLDLLNEAIQFVRDEVNIRQWIAAPTLLNFRNGTLDLSAQTPLLMQHSPRHHLRHCLRREWVDGKADTPSIDQFLSQLTGGKPSEIEKVHCFAAAVLRGLVSLQVYLALIGDPGSGKGTLVNLLIELVGKHAVYATNLESFCGNAFDAGNCYGRRLVVFNDCDQYNGGISKFLNFTGGDEVRGEIKGGASFNFKAEGFILLTANKPVFVRSHPGLSRRTVLVNCVKERGRTSDPTLLAKLSDDLEAYTARLLAIPVERISEVLLEQRQTNPAELASYWQHLTETDSIAAWADESLTLDPSARTPVGKNRDDNAELFGHYSQFCQRAGKTPMAFNTFSASLLTLLKDTMGFEVERIRDRVNPGEPVVMTGVRLKTFNEKGIYLNLSEVMPVMPLAQGKGSGHAASLAKVMPHGKTSAERHDPGTTNGMTETQSEMEWHNRHDSGAVSEKPGESNGRERY
jgi:phage/plasmid-associated DNA primase